MNEKKTFKYYEIRWTGLRGNCIVYRLPDTEIEFFSDSLLAEARIRDFETEIEYFTKEKDTIIIAHADTLKNASATIQDYGGVREKQAAELATQAAALQAQSEEIARLRGFVREIADFQPDTDGSYLQLKQSHLLMYGYWKEKAKELVASWQCDSDESLSVGDTTPESESLKAKPLDWVDKDVIKITGVPIGIRHLVTRNHEAMATFQVMGKFVVAFPRTWQGYQHTIIAAYLVNLHLPFLLKEDNSRDEMQYILTGIEGIDPETWGAESNESESEK